MRIERMKKKKEQNQSQDISFVLLQFVTVDGVLMVYIFSSPSLADRNGKKNTQQTESICWKVWPKNSIQTKAHVAILKKQKVKIIIQLSRLKLHHNNQLYHFTIHFFGEFPPRSFVERLSSPKKYFFIFFFQSFLFVPTLILTLMRNYNCKSKSITTFMTHSMLNWT